MLADTFTQTGLILYGKHMGPLIISQYVVCGICLAIGLLHLALYARLPKRKADLFFALMCFLSAGGTFLEAYLPARL